MTQKTEEQILLEIKDMLKGQKEDFDRSYKDKIDRHIIIFQENFNLLDKKMGDHIKTLNKKIDDHINLSDSKHEELKPLSDLIRDWKAAGRISYPVGVRIMRFLGFISLFVGTIYAIQQFFSSK